MELDEARPAVTELFLPRQAGAEYVVVDRVGYVLQHDCQVGHRQAREDGIGGGAHLPPGQNYDVQGVGNGSQDAHDERKVAMKVLVAVREENGERNGLYINFFSSFII